MKSLYRKVDSFDGQTVTIDGKPCYELASFLGGGAAGVVYEGADVSTSQFRPVAIKILNPVGFRLAPAATLRRCVVARRGQLVGGGGGSSGGGGGDTNGLGGGGVPPSDSSGPSSFSGSMGGGVSATGTGFSSVGGGGGRVGTAGMGMGGRPCKLGPEHVWWLVSPNTKQVLAAYIDPRYGSLVELPLPKCIEIWGLNPRVDSPPSSSSSCSFSSWCRSPNGNAADLDYDCWSDNAPAAAFDADNGIGSETGSPSSTAAVGRGGSGGGGGGGGSGSGGGGGGGAFEVQVDGMGVSIPWLPPKYVQWLSQRRKVKREINNMGRVGGHRNVVELLSVLELLQDSKSTLFLILELVTGGELLDHIRLAGEEGGRAAGFRARAASALRAEGSAQRYFSQLLSGLAYCHRRGVCHRDLSPSNLLLAESPQGDAPPELKVADFGLSACCGGFSATGNENHDVDTKEECRGVPRRVRSVVGSPFYMAPEVGTGNTKGYDGFKADAWSCGVVLYTMLTQSLPFGRDLSRCPRYKRFKNWAERHRIGAKADVPRCSSSSSSLPMAPGGSPSEASFPSPPSSSPSSSTPAHQHQGAPSGRTPPPTSPPLPPVWLFPPMIPADARALLVSLLVPSPSRRLSVEQALSHPWLAGWGGVETPGSGGVTARGGAGSVSSAAGGFEEGGSGGSSAASAGTAEGRGEQQQQQQQQQQQGGGGGGRVGRGGVFATVSGVPDRMARGGNEDGGESETGGGGDGNREAAAVAAAAAAARDKTLLQARDRGSGWGSSTANSRREWASTVPSTTSFP